MMCRCQAMLACVSPSILVQELLGKTKLTLKGIFATQRLTNAANHDFFSPQEMVVKHGPVPHE